MISGKIVKIINDQINFEYYSAYIYFSMCAHFKSQGMNGFANWMQVQTQEEMCHGTGLFNYLIQRGGKVELKAIDKPKTSWKSALEVFEDVYEHECKVTQRIHAIAKSAETEKDYALLNFIQWYISEQVEEEANAQEIIGQLKMIGEIKGALYMLDKDLGTRQFAVPAIPGAGLGATVTP